MISTAISPQSVHDLALFPAAQAMIHLNHAGVAPICGPAANAIHHYAQQATTQPYTNTGWYRKINDLRALAAKLINARTPHEIAVIPNTSTGLATIARGLPWRSGDNVVITNVEYPANRYPWQDLQRLGVTLTEVPQQPDGRIDVEDVCDAITDRTRLVAISHVQYASGFRIDLKPISDTIHKVGGYLCVDAIQSVGVLPVDIQAMGIDFLAADGHKWMLAPEGAGILYVHQDLCQLLHPPIVGWLNMVNADDYGNYDFNFHPDSRRFEPGSYNIPGLLGLHAALEILVGIGTDTLWQRVEHHTNRLAHSLPDLGYRLFTPRRHPEERSGIIVIEPREGQDPATLVRQLADQNIHIALRSGRLRLSPHAYNTDYQIDQALEALKNA
ncbi:MAG: aminotransferase class V-fold PLP-dependent enzyme [Phycisphaeraceae bacterium]